VQPGRRENRVGGFDRAVETETA